MINNENLARDLNIPMIILDIPFNPDYEVSDAEVEYVSAQFWDAVHQLEKLFGLKGQMKSSSRLQVLAAERAELGSYSTGKIRTFSIQWIRSIKPHGCNDMARGKKKQARQWRHSQGYRAPTQ